MSYKALYLKYRPQSFDEVAGQAPIVQTLKNALATGKIAHAYLFAGPRGTGKTTMARLLAKALNCDEGVGHQCNRCDNCLAITEGTHPDVIEIDAASNNGVDQVRDLIDKVKYAPIKGRYKIYIIDEIHMMSTGAFNALLKTLEEPPENVIFILATTEPFKVLPTILSRCQRFDFTKVEEPDMRKKLLEIMGKENVTYDEEGLKALITLADGGMRDALSILDQVLAFSNNELHEKDLRSVYGLTSSAEKIKLLKALGQKDASTLLSCFETFQATGIDIRRLSSDLLIMLKDLLVYAAAKDPKLLDMLSFGEAADLQKSLPTDRASALISLLLKAQNEYRYVSSIRSFFEISLLSFVSQGSALAAPQVAIAPQKPLAPAEAKPEPTPMPIGNDAMTTSSTTNGTEAPEAASTPAMTMAPDPTPIKTIANPSPVESKPLGVPPAVTTPPQEPKPVEPAPSEGPLTQTALLKRPPEFLFQEDDGTVKPAVLDTSKISHSNVAKAGEMFELPDSEMVKIMVLGGASKAERTDLVKTWGSLLNLRTDPKLGNLATLLSEGRPFCLTKECCVLSYQFTRLRDQANVKENQEGLQELMETMLKRKVFIYAIDHKDSSRLQSMYYSLFQVKKLPVKDEIVLDLPKIKED